MPALGPDAVWREERSLSVLTAGPALASDKGDIMAVLNQWNDTDEAKAVAA